MSIKLNNNFLNEIFRSCFLKPSLMEAVHFHLKYQHIPKEYKEYKLILRSMNEQFKSTGKLPSLGTIAQDFSSNVDVLEVLDKIRETEIVDQELLMTRLEEYIKDVWFENVYEHVAELQLNGETDKAKRYNIEETTKIIKFSLRNETRRFKKIHRDFKDSIRNRIEKADNAESERVPFGIPFLDDMCKGGMDVTDTALIMLRSGVGKSTWLKWIGWYAAKLGFKVLHVQCEGSEEEAQILYERISTEASFSNLKFGHFTDEELKKLEAVANRWVTSGKDIDLYAFEKFGDPDMFEVKKIVEDYIAFEGCVPDLILIDSIDLMDPGDGKNYTYDTNGVKMRMQSVAKLMKNLATEFKTRIITATQASNVPKAIWNDPDQVIDRSYIEGDKTLVKPFSFVFTGNQTEEEEKDMIMRIYVDKLRNYKMSQRIIPICTNYDNGRFYDPVRTERVQLELMKQVEERAANRKKRSTKEKKKAS